MTRFKASTLPGLHSIESTDLLGVSLPGEDLSHIELLQQNTRAKDSTRPSTSFQRRSRKPSNARNLKGKNSSETLKGTTQNDRIWGEGGNDNIKGKGGNDQLEGGRGNDNVSGGGGNDKINGDTGNDTLKGNGGNDKINGGDGRDTLKGGGGQDKLKGDAGNDKLQGGSGDDRLDGGAGNDDLDGGRGGDRLSGGDGNDILRIKDLTDTAVGGTGNDRYLLSVALASSKFVERVGGGTDTVEATFAYQLPDNVENLILSGGQSNTINMQSLTAVNTALASFVPGSALAIGQGNALSNTLTGSTANDILSGEAGNDTVNAGLGHDALLGGVGNDRLNGQGGDDLLYGGPGADTLLGEAGNDRLIGGTESDRLEGGQGNDTYVISNNATYNLFDRDNDGENDSLRLEEKENSADSIIEQPNAGIDTLQASGTVILPSNVENLVLIGGTSLPFSTELSDVFQTVATVTPTLDGTSFYSIGQGNELDNVLTGNSGNNYLLGDDGQDILNGGAGADALDGGAGKDTLNGGDGDDLIIGDGADITLSTFGSIFLTNPTSDVFLQRGNDTLNGGNGNDQLLGGRGSDVLQGDDGNDILLGHAVEESLFTLLTTFPSSTEKDILTGGAGADFFVLGDSEENTVFYGGEGFATITDFDALEGDRFVVVGSVFDYTLENAQVSGTVALDTQILYEGDVIAVVQDTTNVIPFLDFVTL